MGHELKLEGDTITVSKKTLGHCYHLESLDVGEFKKSDVIFENDIFEQTPNLKRLNFFRTSLPYKFTEALEPLRNQLEDISFTGVVFYDLKMFLKELSMFTNLRHAWFSECNLEQFPADALKKSAKTLTKLVIRHDDLGPLRAVYLMDFTNIEHLELHDANIDEIEANAFANLKKMQVLDLSSNKITHLKPDFFKNNSELTSLNLKKNPATGALTHGAFSFLTKLEDLQLY